MPGPMGRRRQSHLELPPHMYLKRGRYYYGRAGIALGGDFGQALRRYAELHGGTAGPGTFAEAARLYLRDELPKKAAKTADEYERQLGTLVRVFGRCPLAGDSIRPKDVHDYLAARPRIAGAREKALLSAVWNFARRIGLTDAPNPCAGIRAPKARRSRYVTDDELRAAIEASDQTLAAFLELTYRTGQRPGDVLRMRRADVRDGALWVSQAKTGARVRIAVVGPLEALLERLRGIDGVASFYLIHNHRGQPLSLPAMQKRWDVVRRRIGADWQLRDLRAKAATDTEASAQELLGHAAASTTDGYIRRVAGALADPVRRPLFGQASQTKKSTE